MKVMIRMTSANATICPSREIAEARSSEEKSASRTVAQTSLQICAPETPKKRIRGEAAKASYSFVVWNARQADTTESKRSFQVVLVILALSRMDPVHHVSRAA